MKRRAALLALIALALGAHPASALAELSEPTPSAVAKSPIGPAKAAWKMPALFLTLGVVPQARKLRGEARFTVVPPAPGHKTLRLRLHPGLKVTRVDVQWRPAKYTRSGEFLDVKLGPYPAGQALAITVGYAGRPLETQGGKRKQDVGPEGLLLTPGGRWYPTLPGAAPTSGPVASTIRLTVPSIWRALSPAGNHNFDRGSQTYRFEFAQGDPLALAASRLSRVPYSGAIAYMRPAGGATRVSEAAIKAELQRGQAVLDLYGAHGIRVPKLAGTVLELPKDFAPLVLPQWQARPQQPGGIAKWLTGSPWSLSGAVSPLERQWLGASLTAYTDDLMAERRGGQAGYRKAIAAHRRAYEAFLTATPWLDAPLSRAIAPTHAAYEPIVVHKGAMVWAQLREALGDAAFWELLKGYQTDRTRGMAPMPAFEAAGGPQVAVVTPWLTQSGLPAYRLRDVAVTEAEGSFQVTGKLVAETGHGALPLELALITAEDIQRVRFQAFGPEMPFHFVSPSKPLRLLLDPEQTLPLRRRTHLLVSQGVAPADGLIVYGTQGGPTEAAANQEAARAMAERLKRSQQLELPIKADSEVTEEDKQHSLLLFGRPSTNSLADEWSDQFPVRFLGDKGLWWQGRTYTHPDFATVEIIANPAAPERTVVLFASLTAKHMADTLAYSRQNATFCVFDGAHMVEAGRVLCPFPDQEAVLY